MGDGGAVGNVLHALGIVSADEQAADSGLVDRQRQRAADASRSPEVQQQAGWSQFFEHGLEDLIPDTGANGGGCLVVYVVYDDEESVKKFGSEWEKG